MKTLFQLRPGGVVLLLFGCVLLAGCGVVRSKQDGERVLARHFQCIATNGYDTALADYSADFFKKTTKEDWQNKLERQSDRLGAYQSYSVTRWQVFKKVGAGAGTYVTLECRVVYQKSTVPERFVIFKGPADTEYKITQHTLTTGGLKKGSS